MTALRLGVIGSGGRGHIAKFAHNPDEDIRVVACCDRNDKALQRNREDYGSDVLTTTDMDTLLSQDLDAVFVCTPDYLHEEQAVACLNAGVSVYLEKPLAISIEGCDRVLQAAEQSSGKLFVGHNMRYMHIIRKMKQLIDDDVIGEVKSVWCRHFISYGGDAYFRDWHSEQQYANSLLLQKGAHDIDVMHWLSGANTTRVSAFGNLSVYDKCNRRAEDEAGKTSWDTDAYPPLEQSGFSPTINVEDQNTVIMEMEKGILGSYLQCHFSPDSCRNYTIIGTKGRIENMGDGPTDPIMLWNKRTDTYNMIGDEVFRGATAVRRTNQDGHGGSDEIIVQEFIDYLRGDVTETTATPEAARHAVAVGCKAAESLRSGGGALDVPAINRTAAVSVS